MKCKLSIKAEQDILDITKYLKTKNFQSAEIFFDQIEQVEKMLCSFPQMAPLIEEKFHKSISHYLKETRFLVVPKFKNYVIFYKVDKTKITIIRIIHIKRNVLDLLDN